MFISKLLLQVTLEILPLKIVLCESVKKGKNLTTRVNDIFFFFFFSDKFDIFFNVSSGIIRGQHLTLHVRVDCSLPSCFQIFAPSETSRKVSGNTADYNSA